MSPLVSLQRLADYQRSDVRAALRLLLEPLGGIQAFVKPGEQVLLKPNLLSGKHPDRAVTTHPEIVRAVAELALEAGDTCFAGHLIGSPEQVARKAGILDIADDLGIAFVPFVNSVKIRPSDGTFHELEVARELLEADVVINLPKLKTHQMMGLTCAVKNMFGAVVGLRKPRLHLQAGTDKAFFALMLLELCETLAPALTIVDAVVGMEGNGPGSGDPVRIGALLAGRHPQAVDTVATQLVGMRPRQVLTQWQAIQTGRSCTDLAELELAGTPLEELQVGNFRPARMTDVNFGLKGGLKRYLKNALTARPEAAEERCIRCGDCVRHCPPEAMAIEAGRLTIDYEKCIRCFCCQELCPHGALLTRQGILLRLHAFLQGGK